MTEKDVDNMIRANERRILREKLICAALTGILAGAEEYFYDVAAEHSIAVADLVLAWLDEEAAK